MQQSNHNMTKVAKLHTTSGTGVEDARTIEQHELDYQWNSKFLNWVSPQKLRRDNLGLFGSLPADELCRSFLTDRRNELANGSGGCFSVVNPLEFDQLVEIDQERKQFVILCF